MARSSFNESPSWAPDGKRIAVAHYVNGGPQLAIVDPRTRTLRRITQSEALDEGPAWSPDGRRIVFSRSPLLGGGGIWATSPSGAGQRQLTNNQSGDWRPAWLPNGRLIAFDRSTDLWVMRSDGSAQHRLVSKAGHAAWSPNGRQIAFGRPTVRSCGCHVTNLYVTDASGHSPRLVARNGGAPTWSPDNSRIVFRRFEAGRSHLWIVNADGSHLLRLTGGTHSQSAPARQP